MHAHVPLHWGSAFYVLPARGKAGPIMKSDKKHDKKVATVKLHTYVYN